MKPTIKSILNLTWKVGLGLFGLAALGIGLLIAHSWYEDSYGRAYWKDKTLSKDISVHGFNNNRVRVWDKRTARYITPKLMWVSGAPDCDSITVYCDKDGNRGYINCNTGKIVIPAQKAKYNRAWHFSKGRAFVVLPGEDSLSVIDYSGKVVVKNIATYDYGYDYVFENGLCELRVNRMKGLFAADGTWAVEPKYYDIDYPNTFGYRIARNEDGYWLYDSDFKLVFSEPYDKLSYAIGRDEGTGTLYRTKNHVKQLVNYDGSIVEPFVIDDTYNLKYMTRYNEESENEYALDPDLVVYRVNDWEGLMDKHTGHIITPAIYIDFKMISKDLIKAELGMSYDDEAVVMDKRGHIVKQHIKYE